MTTEPYQSWSNHTEIVLRGKGLWQFVELEPILRELLGGTLSSQVEHDEHLTDVVLRKADEQERNLALAYNLEWVVDTCRAMVQAMRCPGKIWSDLRETVKPVSEACIDAILLKLQAVILKKDSHFVEYSSRI